MFSTKTAMEIQMHYGRGASSFSEENFEVIYLISEVA